MQNLKGRNTLTFILGDSLASKMLAEAFDHRKNPATVAALFYHKRCLHHPHVAIYAASSLAGAMQTSAELGGLTVVSALVCRSQEPGCQGKSLPN